MPEVSAEGLAAEGLQGLCEEMQPVPEGSGRSDSPTQPLNHRNGALGKAC